MDLQVYVEIASQVVAGAAAISAIFPKAEKLTGFLLLFRKVVDVLALNVFNAKNK
jgi:hypothetical protein